MVATPTYVVYVAEIAVGRVTNRAAFATPGAAWIWIGQQPVDPKASLAQRAKVHQLTLDALPEPKK